MIIAITSTGNVWDSMVDDRFGRAETLVLINDEDNTLSAVSNEDAKSQAHGAGPKAAQLAVSQDVEVLITGNGPGGNAASMLEKAEIRVFIGAGGKSIKEAYQAYKDGLLEAF